MKLTFTIYGAPRTKKTSNRLVRCGRFHKILPSKAFEVWNAMAQIYIAKLRGQSSEIQNWNRFGYQHDQVNCAAVFYRDAERGDLVGYQQALADALEEAGIVENDKLIVSWDGSRLAKDRHDPRIEVTLEVAA